MVYLFRTIFLFSMILTALFVPHVYALKVQVKVPNQCCRLDRVEGNRVYVKSSEKHCAQGISDIAVDVPDDTERVQVYVDGRPWVNTVVGADGNGWQTPMREFDMAAVDRARRSAESYSKKIAVPDNPYRAEAQQRAQTMADYRRSNEFQERIDAERERQLSGVFPEVLKDYYPNATAPGGFQPASGEPGSERVYVFISSSVPESTLRNYMASLDKLGDPGITVVLRGFVGGMTHMMPTIDFITGIMKRDQTCGHESTQCEMYRVNVQIDPLLFRSYKIGEVPTFVYARGLTIRDPMMGEGTKYNAKADDFVSVSGDVSVEYALESLNREAKSGFLERLLKKIGHSQ
ncbi:MAG: type-F conjugative transfer system pilin assembly protein TrbC [Syntrophales bacterium]